MRQHYTAWTDEMWRRIEEKMHTVVCRNPGIIPYTTDENGRYIDRYAASPAFWTNGFWPGILWYLYQETGDELYRREAEQAEEKLDCLLTLEKGGDAIDHDVGFLWHLSAGADELLTGNAQSRVRIRRAADLLMARFNPDGRFFTAWNGPERQGWSIIDTMMNLPLLYRTAEQTGYTRYARAAQAHADHTMQYMLRPDGSSAHVAVYDPVDGHLLHWLAGQGAAPDSVWSRGQGWAVYGFALSYRYTRKPEYLQAARRAAVYVEAALQRTGWVPHSDFCGDKPLLDATAGAILANGMLELAEHLPEEAEHWQESAFHILTALESCCDWNLAHDAILQNCSERYTDEKQMMILYGDYFLMEAVLRLKGGAKLLW